MSDLIFATPSWFTGFARTLDLAGLFNDYNNGLTDHQADWVALTSDLETVQQDFWVAFNQYSETFPDAIRQKMVRKHRATYIDEYRERRRRKALSDTTKENELSWAG